MINSTRAKYIETANAGMGIKNPHEHPEQVTALAKKILAAYTDKDLEALHSRPKTLEEKVDKLKKLSELQQKIFSDTQKLNRIYKTAHSFDRLYNHLDIYYSEKALEARDIDFKLRGEIGSTCSSIKKDRKNSGVPAKKHDSC